MRQPRMMIVLLTMVLGVSGAWLGVCAQDRRTPWPPMAPAASESGSTNIEVAAVALSPQPSAPIVREGKVVPTDHQIPSTLLSAQPVNTTETQPPEVVIPPNVAPSPPSAPVPTIVVPETSEAPAAPSPTPRKLPAEIPAQPLKSEAKAPDVPAPLAPPPLKADVPAPTSTPKNSDAPPPVPTLENVDIRPPAPKTADVPAPVPTPKTVEVPPAPTPKTVDIPPPLPPGPMPSLTDVPPVPELLPAPSIRLPKTPARQEVAVPAVPEPEPVPRLREEPKKDQAAPLEAPPALPKVETPAPSKNIPPPSSGFGAKPLAAPVGPTMPVAPAPLASPEVPASSAPMPHTPSPVESKAPQSPSSRPPAFLLVKPRRVEAAPAPVPSLLDVARPPEAPLVSSIAQVTVEKRGPTVLRQGVATSYQIIVRNRGPVASGPITVVDEIPRLAKILAGQPAPAQLGDKAIWTLAPLPANSETLLQLELQANGAGEFVGNTTVFVSSNTATTRAQIQRDTTATPVSSGPLNIHVRGPVGGVVGQPVLFEVQVTNQSKQTITELVLHAKLSDGLSHPAGNNIEADVGDLAPGANKSFKMPVTAKRAGRQTVAVKITAAGGVEAQTETAVPINNGLSIQLAPTTRLMLDRAGEVRIEVTNFQGEGLRNVVIAQSLPDKLDFVEASDRGIYQAGTRTVQWLLDVLPAGETRTLALRVQGKTPGQFTQEVSARAESLPETRVQGLVQVEGYTSLTLQVTPRDQPLEMGKETICEVRVQNQGSAAASGVQLQVELPPGLTPGYVQGPTAHRMQGRTLIFETIANLPARTQAVYHVGVSAQAVGDLRVRVQAVSAQERAPILREVPLVVYRDR